MQKLINKPDLDEALARIDAWFRQEVIDRPPVRFTAHNSSHVDQPHPKDRWPNLKARWFDAEYQVDFFINSMRGVKFLAETFPVFMPNLGPEVYSAFYGCELTFQEVTSYCVPKVNDWADTDGLCFDKNNEYFLKIEELTRVALEKCDGSYWVGYTDLHPGADCAAAWRDPQQLCMDLLFSPDETKRLVQKAEADFQRIYDYYDTLLKSHRQPSGTWIGIPARGRLHIPCCDFSAMISPAHFEEFFLPAIKNEISTMTHNIFHVDGRGVARHLDYILALPGVQAIQWVQGVGNDQPIMRWLPLIRKVLDAGKSILLDITMDELEPLKRAIGPEGVMLSIAAPESAQPGIIAALEDWKRSA